MFELLKVIGHLVLWYIVCQITVKIHFSVVVLTVFALDKSGWGCEEQYISAFIYDSPFFQTMVEYLLLETAIRKYILVFNLHIIQGRWGWLF